MSWENTLKKQEAKINDTVRYKGLDQNQLSYGRSDRPEDKGVKVGQLLNIANIEQYDSYTHYMFKEIDGRYNSVGFEVVEKQ